eukprot:4005380-Prymnesium_polylepis.1
MAVNDWLAAKAARKADCCPMALSRAISRLKDAKVYETHMDELRARHAQQLTDSMQTRTRKLEMASPSSLGKQIKSGATRLRDGRPYGGKGNSWGEYREGWKIGTQAIRDIGEHFTQADAREASEKLEAAGVHIGARTCSLWNGAKEAPGATPVKMGKQIQKLPDGFVEAGRKIVLEMREKDLPNLKCMLKAELNAMLKDS